MMVCLLWSYFSWLTPMTIVMSSPLAGAEMMTFCAGCQVAPGLLGFGEQAGRFDDVLDAKLLPRQGGRPFLDGEALDRVAVDDERVVFGGARRLLAGDRAAEPTLRRVVLEQVGEVVGRDEVVDGHHVERLAEQPLLDQVEDEAADAAEAVDAHFHCHRFNSFLATSYQLLAVSQSSRPRLE